MDKFSDVKIKNFYVAADSKKTSHKLGEDICNTYKKGEVSRTFKELPMSKE